MSAVSCVTCDEYGSLLSEVGGRISEYWVCGYTERLRVNRVILRRVTAEADAHILLAHPRSDAAVIIRGERAKAEASAEAYAREEL